MSAENSAGSADQSLPSSSASPRAESEPSPAAASSTPSRSSNDAVPDDGADPADAGGDPARKRRRGSRGGKNRRRPAAVVDGDGEPFTEVAAGAEGDRNEDSRSSSSASAGEGRAPSARSSRPPKARSPRPPVDDLRNPDLPDPPHEGQVRVPEIEEPDPVVGDTNVSPDETRRDRQSKSVNPKTSPTRPAGPEDRPPSGRGRRGKAGNPRSSDLAEPARDAPRDRNGKPLGRYLMCVHTRPAATQIAVLEGRSLIEHYVSRPTDQVAQIHGNLYLGRVQNVLPGMEAAFVDIGTPKNAVLYRSDVSVDLGEIEGTGGSRSGRKKQNDSRIEDILKNGQLIVCQVTKNPIGAKGARLTQEVSLPGRFVVLIPNSETYGISKRLGDDERKRLRRILDEVRPEGHGMIVRTAAEGATADELRADVIELGRLWAEIDAKAKRSKGPTLLHREPDLAVRVIREEFNRNYRGVVLDDRQLFEEVRSYVERITPELADRVEFYDTAKEGLPLFERHHVHEQLHKAIDRKVWLPSGGSLIIERTEALTVIDVNTGKNVGSSNLEETVFRNNLEAGEEIARQLRLRDIGGIIVIDFIDMEIRANREALMTQFRSALSRDKTRTQVFEVSELGLVEMTRKRISEGLVEALSGTCPTCGGRGITFDESLIG